MEKHNSSENQITQDTTVSTEAKDLFLKNSTKNEALDIIKNPNINPRVLDSNEEFEEYRKIRASQELEIAKKMELLFNGIVDGSISNKKEALALFEENKPPLSYKQINKIKNSINKYFLKKNEVQKLINKKSAPEIIKLLIKDIKKQKSEILFKDIESLDPNANHEIINGHSNSAINIAIDGSQYKEHIGDEIACAESNTSIPFCLYNKDKFSSDTIQHEEMHILHDYFFSDTSEFKTQVKTEILAYMENKFSIQSLAQILEQDYKKHNDLLKNKETPLKYKNNNLSAEQNAQNFRLQIINDRLESLEILRQKYPQEYKWLLGITPLDHWKRLVDRHVRKDELMTLNLSHQKLQNIRALYVELRLLKKYIEKNSIPIPEESLQILETFTNLINPKSPKFYEDFQTYGDLKKRILITQEYHIIKLILESLKSYPGATEKRKELIRNLES